MTTYDQTRGRVEEYFDRTATRTWERLTSDAPVSRIRETVRQGRDRMRATMLGQLPQDLTGRRVLDAGCGTGLASIALAQRGAEVVAVDISPSLVEIAAQRTPDDLRDRISYRAGDMLDAGLGQFDHVIAMDSLIYYQASDIGKALVALGPRVGSVVFTVAPRTPFLMLFYAIGKMFPRSDRSPVMIPHDPASLTIAAKGEGASGQIREIARITSGFYISTCLEYRS